MTYPRTITARLLDTNGVTVISGSPLAAAFGITFKDEHNGPGVGTLSLPLSEAGAAQLTSGRFIDVLVEGVSRFTFEIEGEPDYDIVIEGDEFAEIVRVQGRGWGCALDKVIVEPEVAFGLKLDAPWRIFSFASPSFPNGGSWALADELYEYLDAVSAQTSVATPVGRFQEASDGQVYPAPISFPVPTSRYFYDPASPPGANYVPVYWIWPPGQDISLGYGFFRRTLTIAEDGVYMFAVTGDNFFTLFLEGVPILGEQTDHFIWTAWKEEPIFLPAGTYQVAAAVQNYDINLAVNPAGFMMTVHKLDVAGNLPNAVFLVTDDAWTSLFVGNEGFWPGWTPGQIVDKMITEALARPNALNAFDPGPFTFTATNDSATNPWSSSVASSAYVPAFSVEVGTTIMAALDKLHEEGHVDWHMRSGTMILDVWAANQVGTTPGVTLAAGVNLVALQRGATTVYANALLVQWEGGYVRLPLPGDTARNAIITARGTRIEDIYSSEATSEDEAVRLGNVELDQRAIDGLPAVLATVEPVNTNDCPYEGFDLGDTITIPDVFGGTEQVKVLSISCEQDDLGFAIWRLELNHPWRSIVREQHDLMREIGGRSGYTNGRVR